MKTTITALAALALFCSAWAQKAPMTPERLWELGRVSLDAASPDGKSFVYGVTRYDTEENKGNRDLYLMHTDGEKTIRLTDMEGGEYGAHYLLDGERIGFSKGGQFHLIDPNGENLTTITDFEEGADNIKAYTLPDGRIALLFTISVKLEQSTSDLYPELPKANARIIDNLMYRHWDSWSDDRYNHVCIAYYDPSKPGKITDYQDLMQGEKFDSPLNPFGGSESFTLSPDGKTVVYEAKKKSGKEWAVSTNSDLYMVNLSDMKTTNITQGMQGYDKEPGFSPDGSKLAWLSMATEGYESDVNDLVVMDVSSGAKIHVLKAMGLYDDKTFQSYAWKDERNLYVGVPENGTNQIYALNLPKKVSADGKATLKAVSEGQYNWNHFEVAGKNLLVDRQDMNHATETYLLNPKSKKAIQLTQVNDGIYQNTKMSRIDKRMVKTSDGKEMLTWVIYPPDFDPAKKYPTLLYCQGGPQSQVSQFYSFRWNFQLMAAQGYIVVAPNRRGLPGFGREWNEQISKDWGGQAMRDYLAAIDEVSKEPWSDENQLGCIGASYGGYSVYMLAGIHNKRFDAFISHCGLFDLESWYLSTEELFFANYDLGGPYWLAANKESYTRFDPKDYVQNWDTPILVIHGGKDFRVPENQGMEAFQAAQLQGVPSKFLYFPEEGHWILSPQNGLIWHDQFFGWLDKWLKDGK